MDFDVIIVGAGPAGLSAAIRLKQLNSAIEVCIIEKGAEVGSHILGGAILEPRALDELIPDWRNRNPFPATPVIQDKFLFLTEKKSFRLPTPPQMNNHGNYIISAGLLCKWLAREAESLGVNIFPSFAATEMLFDGDKVSGIRTGDKGCDRHGNETALFQPGMDLHAKHVFLAEGCRGSLTQKLFERFDLRKECDPQTYGLGIKELWEIPEELHESGLVIHTINWPLKQDTYGGGFIYHFEKNILSIGFVVGLDYQNPYLNIYEEFQKFKTHPILYPILERSKRIAYGARALNEGGFQAIPQLTFPGGLIIGCAAGFLNVPKIKGIHNAMKSGMVAAESVIHNTDYSQNIKQSWTWKELHKVRNIRPALTWGLIPGLLYAGFDTYILRGNAPWTFKTHADYKQLKPAKSCKKIEYPKHDKKVTFDLLNSLFLANVEYVEDQPYHLKLKNRALAIEVNYKEYASPETRYCPAGVYEIVFKEDNQPRLQINGGNCIQCKTCDIKDPLQNIVWTPSEGGSGPQYTMM